MRDFFNLQDEITLKIVVELLVEVGGGEGVRLSAKSTDSFEAWTNVRKGWKFFIKLNKEDNLKARALFEAAIKLDPGYTNAWRWLAQSYVTGATLDRKSRAASLKLAFEAAQKALSLDDKNPGVHAVLGNLYLAQRQLEKAISEYTMVISINPNLAIGYALLARAKMHMGEFEESITLMKKAMRLSPYYPAWFLVYLGNSYRFTGRYEEAIVAHKQHLDRCRKGDGPTWLALARLSEVYAELGRVEEARVLMAEARVIVPKLSLVGYKKANFFKNPAHLQRIHDAASKAGLK